MGILDLLYLWLAFGNGLINWIYYHYHCGSGYFKFKYCYLSYAFDIDICGWKLSPQQFPRNLHNQNWGLTGVYKQRYLDYLKFWILFLSCFLWESGIVPHVSRWHIIPWQQMHGLAMLSWDCLHICIFNLSIKFYLLSLKKKLVHLRSRTN